MEIWLENFARANFARSADTAHDLKTPLNVAVLNLELLRMRLRKLALADDKNADADGDGDEKISVYMRAIEVELRRLGQIFDAFFLMSTPPYDEGAPAAIDLAPILTEAAASASVAISLVSNGRLPVLAHEPRIRRAVRLFFEGAAKLFDNGMDIAAALAREGHRLEVTVAGTPAAESFEPTRIFKFYYSDAGGNPDLSLAVARLIAETYGGEVDATVDRDKVSLRLSFPLGEE
jgi:signal transduction histidine kinase